MRSENIDLFPLNISYLYSCLFLYFCFSIYHEALLFRCIHSKLGILSSSNFIYRSNGNAIREIFQVWRRKKTCHFVTFFENEVYKRHTERKFWGKWHCCRANVTEFDIETHRLRDSFRIRSFHFFIIIYLLVRITLFYIASIISNSM